MTIIAVVYLETSPWLQITVSHRTLAEQNLLMSDQSLSEVGHNVWTLFLRKKISSVMYMVGPSFLSLKVAYIYISICIYLYIYLVKSN